jgi:hypothetical protein
LNGRSLQKEKGKKAGKRGLNDIVGPKAIEKNMPRKNFDSIFGSSGICVHGYHNITACLILLFKGSDSL